MRENLHRGASQQRIVTSQYEAIQFERVRFGYDYEIPTFLSVLILIIIKSGALKAKTTISI